VVIGISRALGLEPSLAARYAGGKPKRERDMAEAELAHLAVSGAEIAVRVTPKASRNLVVQAEDGLRVYVTVVPEDGKANAAVVKLLAKALGVAKGRLLLIRGATSRDKVFRLD
jgi:uncharacterized protein